MDLKDGTTLNNLLFQILDFDPTAVKSGRAMTALSPSAIREIPFEWDSEAITVLHRPDDRQRVAPGPLMDPMYVDDRNALHAAVAPALEEDAKGTVSTGNNASESTKRSRAFGPSS